MKRTKRILLPVAVAVSVFFSFQLANAESESGGVGAAGSSESGGPQGSVSTGNSAGVGNTGASETGGMTSAGGESKAGTQNQSQTGGSDKTSSQSGGIPNSKQTTNAPPAVWGVDNRTAPPGWGSGTVVKQTTTTARPAGTTVRTSSAKVVRRPNAKWKTVNYNWKNKSRRVVTSGHTRTKTHSRTASVRTWNR